MDKREFYFYDLPYWRDLIRFGEAMVYAFNRESIFDFDKEKHNSWKNIVKSRTNQEVCEEIKDFKQKNAELLAESPILAGLLDSYIAASETRDTARLKKIYKAFMAMQKDIPFEQNKETYIDAGCTIAFKETSNGVATVYFPISLYVKYGHDSH